MNYETAVRAELEKHRPVALHWLNIPALHRLEKRCREVKVPAIRVKDMGAAEQVDYMFAQLRSIVGKRLPEETMKKIMVGMDLGFAPPATVTMVAPG